MKIKNIIDGTILGEGVVMGMWGSTFHTRLVVEPFVKVKITKVKVPTAPLMVPNLEDSPIQTTLGNAKGSVVLWSIRNLRKFH